MAAIQHGSNTFHWNLMTSDRRPDSGVPEGSTCHYVDTGEQYIRHNSMWVRDLRWSNALNGTNN